jgi:hypothetical protein
MLYLAMSCLQGRPMESAAADLVGHGEVGLQLTPGNAPTRNFLGWIERQGITHRTHHGFCTSAMRRRVWSAEADCLVPHHSVHPPETKHGLDDLWKRRAERGDYAGILMETMYPGYPLGDGDDLEWAMDAEIPLAVDVSHIHIQRTQNVLSEGVWKRLQAYPRIGELHLSANRGDADTHQPLTPESFGLAWVRERAQAGIPVVLECYMHRLSPAERQRQIELARP